jgi:putative FmdB family regulatory protein
MPIYDYRCDGCRRRTSFYYQTFSAADTAERACEHCGSSALTKMISRVVFHRSEESKYEDYPDDSAMADVDENDPRSVARWARKMGEQFGEDLGDEFHEMVDQMEAGELDDEMAGAAALDTHDHTV